MPRPISSLSVQDLLPPQPANHGRIRLLPAQSAQGLAVFDPKQHTTPGLNFATQDYLALAAHPALRSAAMAALGQHRLGAPGSAPAMGMTTPVLALESRTARFLQMPCAVAFPSGADAIRTTLHTILRPGDDVIVDTNAHPAMFETVLTARARLHRSPAASVEGVERRLRRLSSQPRRGQIYVALAAVSAQSSQIIDLAELAELCCTHDARLIVDTSHDLGSMAQNGGGVMEIQGCMGRIDIVLGSFAKCFGASGGFAAFRDPALRDQLRRGQAGQWRTAALSPINASAILAAFDIVDSAEGRRRRRRLHGSTLRLRNHLMADGLRVMGQPSPLVPVRLPPLTALPRTALLESAGPMLTLLQAPLVAAHAPRWRVQLSSDHGAADIDDLAELIRDVTRAFDRQSRPVRRVALPQP